MRTVQLLDLQPKCCQIHCFHATRPGILRPGPGQGNPRHEHEWKIWNEFKLPDDKVLIPGVVSHCVYQVEHPELVAERIEKFASIVGRERVVAGTDCGFATSRAGDELHPEVAWAKLGAMVEGAAIASGRLWKRGH